MAQKYKEICTDYQITEATLTRDGEMEFYSIKAQELSSIPSSVASS